MPVVSCAVRATSHETRGEERERHQSPLWSLRPAARAESCVRKRTPMHTCTQNILHVALYRIDEQENTCDDTHPTPSSRHRGAARRQTPRCSSTSSCSRRSSGFVGRPRRARRAPPNRAARRSAPEHTISPCAAHSPRRTTSPAAPKPRGTSVHATGQRHINACRRYATARTEATTLSGAASAPSAEC